MHLMRYSLPHLMETNHGNIMLTTTHMWQKGDPNLTTLSVGQAALRNLVQTYQQQLKGSNIVIGYLTLLDIYNGKNEHYSPEQIGEHFWKLYMKMQKERSCKIIL